MYHKMFQFENLNGVMIFNTWEYTEEGCMIEEQPLAEVEYFCYLGDVLDCKSDVERSVSARVAAAWTKWRNVSVLLINKYSTS